MRHRIEELLERPTRGMWVGTFHSLAHRMLRAHWRECGLAQSFQIIDNLDQQRMIRRVVRELQLDEKQFPPRSAQSLINNWKDTMLRPGALQDENDHTLAAMIKIYTHYQEHCERSGLVDFAELLLRAWELLSSHRTVLEDYQRRFPLLLVDEYQDTNNLQHRWLMLLAGQRGSLFAVGDDDQSIYSWRGAQFKHMQQFQNQLQGARLVRLEQNYRSTGTILNAANALISHNTTRLGKKLWTAGQAGESLQLYEAYSENDEAKYVVQWIRRAARQGANWKDHAVLYRVSALSRVLEEVLVREGIPYRVHGGLRFYERAEIKDAMAYLRLAHSHDDDASYERIVNTPARGIGQRTMDKLRGLARGSGTSLWRASVALLGQDDVSSRAAAALTEFMRRMEDMGQQLKTELPLHERVAAALQLSGLVEHFQKERGEVGQSRVENLGELVSAASAFRPEEESEEQDPLAAFIAQAALESGEKQAGESSDCVHLMTLHAAKGLEFPQVFLVGMEEELFPHKLSVSNSSRLEEERRLCYVGITRARQGLSLSWAQHRRLHGKDCYPEVSRFVRELPLELCQSVRVGGAMPGGMKRGTPRTPDGAEAAQAEPNSLKPGQRVLHAKFGEGTVLHLEGAGAHTRVQINFTNAGCKWLLASHAKLQRL